MNRPFGVPALAGLPAEGPAQAGPDRLKAELQTSGFPTGRFMVPMHAEKTKGALHEPQSAAGILPAEELDEAQVLKANSSPSLRRRAESERAILLSTR
jgi:hypothetical protein